ncbi:MAG: hypothetical protein PHR28_11950 [candidate division Zixibacteria bacterium]|nr:hypothetical protein [candidate division Zixibacteria bacterium]
MRCKCLFPVVLGLSLLLAVPAFSQTEDEVIARFLQKAEKNTVEKQQKKVGFVVFNGSYGRLKNMNDYNQFAEGMSPFVTGLNGSYDHIDGIFRSKEFFGGMGYMVTPKFSLTGGFSYWLKMGNTPVGDYDLSLAFPTDTAAHNEFELESEVQVYGISVDAGYYLINPPDNNAVLKAIAVKLSLGTGYYFANWSLWQGYLGYNLSTQDYEEIGGKLTGKAPGIMAGISFEVPLKVAGLVMEGMARYQYLNFGKMKWYNDESEETVVVHQGSQERVKLDLSGPRAQFGLKRYFSW